MFEFSLICFSWFYSEHDRLLNPCLRYVGVTFLASSYSRGNNFEFQHAKIKSDYSSSFKGAIT